MGRKTKNIKQKKSSIKNNSISAETKPVVAEKEIEEPEKIVVDEPTEFIEPEVVQEEQSMSEVVVETFDATPKYINAHIVEQMEYEEMPIVKEPVKYEMPDNRQHIMVDEGRIIHNLLGDTVLDVGCGIGRWGYLIKQSYPNIKVTGIDIYKSYVDQAIASGAYEEVINDSFMNIDFKPKSFDTVIAVEVLEHVSKEEGTKLLKTIESVAKRKVILTTPSGYYELDTELENECHKSGWTKPELERLGYVVFPYPFRWDGTIINKEGKPVDISVNREWLFCVKEV